MRRAPHRVRAARRRTAAASSWSPTRSRPRTAHKAWRRSRPSERKASASASFSSAAGLRPLAEPEVAHRIVALRPPLDELSHILLLDADDLPQAEPHGVGRADVLGHRGVAGVDPSPALGRSENARLSTGYAGEGGAKRRMRACRTSPHPGPLPQAGEGEEAPACSPSPTG